MNPWKTIDRTTVYENNWITVEHRNVLNPVGNPGIYGVVHFKNVAIGIVPVDLDGNTWLVGQFRYTLNEYSWEIPKGGGLENTVEIESAKRELLEETGISAEKWSILSPVHTSNSVTDERGLLYLAENLNFGEAEPEETEQLIVKKLPLAEAVKMVLGGEITDAISIIGLLLADRILKNRPIHPAF
jgi:8-oxo-dGTP pyrophosphatase MutT (NUDIX family)